MLSSPTRCSEVTYSPGPSSRATIVRTTSCSRWTSTRTSRSPSTASSTDTDTPSGRGCDIGSDRRSDWVERPLRVGGAGVRDARVVDARQQRHERLLDARQVAQREIAVVELTLVQALAHDAVDQVLDGLARVVARRAGGGLGAIGQHQQ